ncbi:MAG: undecaprenyl-diphosphate phosphatase [Acidimicrobiia bacterium]
MLAAAIWGLIQGLTEFLPVSSSGHLVIIPAFLNHFGLDVEPPSLAVTAVLHLGTLLAVLVYFREDVLKVFRFRTEPEGRKIALMVAIGTIPALIGLPLAGDINRFQTSVVNVGWALMATGLILCIGQLLATGDRRLTSIKIPDAIVIGIAQAVALIPGISRSGTTISMGDSQRFEPTEAARFSFLLGIPAIAGGGLLELLMISDTSELSPELLIGMAVAAITGYFAIAVLLKILGRIGLIPFAFYCLAVGLATVLVF